MICSCVLSIYTEKNHRKRILKIVHFLQNSGFFFSQNEQFFSKKNKIRIVEKIIHIENPFVRIFVSVVVYLVSKPYCWVEEYMVVKSSWIKHAKCSPFDINIIHESFFIWFPARTIPYSPDKPKALRKLNIVSRNEQGRPLKELY